jgi:hypothetical protein
MQENSNRFGAKAGHAAVHRRCDHDACKWFESNCVKMNPRVHVFDARAPNFTLE